MIMMQGRSMEKNIHLVILSMKTKFVPILFVLACKTIEYFVTVQMLVILSGTWGSIRQ